MTTPAPSPTPMVKTPHRWNTLKTLRAALWAVPALDLLLLLACVAGAWVHRGAMQTIGKSAAPAILAAQQIKTALADMNADAAKDLLLRSLSNDHAWRERYNQRRSQLAETIIDAAHDIAFGPEERRPIETIQIQLGIYEARIQRAFDLADERNPAAISAYNEAAGLADRVLLTAADDFDGLNERQIEAAYSSAETWSVASRAFILLAGIALLVALLWLQAFLTDRTRRILNLALLGATLAALGWTMWSFTLLGAGESDLKVAKEDAFSSLRALWLARATAHSADADQSRYLLLPANAAQLTADFARQRKLLLDPPPGVTLESIAASGLNEESGASGYFEDALQSIRSPADREVLATVTQRYAGYLIIDRDIRGLERSGSHEGAVGLCLGMEPGQAGYAFSQFDSALERAISISRGSFDAALASGFDALSHFEMEAAAAAAVIALLVIAGLMPRIAEYR